MTPYEKYHGTGNEFVVVDADAHEVADRASFAAAACDRDDGVGADGVLFLSVRDGDADPPRVEFRLYQPDGSTAAMCGNGARVAAVWARARTGRDEATLETPAGDRHAVVDGDEVTVEMGTPSFDPADVPIDRDEPMVAEPLGGYTVTAVNTGVPHAVAFVSDVDRVDVAMDAPRIRHADVFPEGANATFASPLPDAWPGYAQRTFERGVEAETRACGTGAVAVAAAARREGHTDAASMPVRPPGGELHVAFTEDGRATLRGPVAFEFAGEFDPATVR
ncbi:MAG: diaminopimelate epimerase [Halobacteriaceae archaeon]